MKILVTGASGFVGLNLVAKLSKKHQIRALVRPSSQSNQLKDLGVELFYGDLTDSKTLTEALKNIEAVYHLAAVLPNTPVAEKVYWQVNVQATKNLLNAASQTSSLKHFIHLSTAYVCWNETLFADEKTPCSPDLIYEKTKYEGERIISKAIGKTNFPVTIIRPGWLYGKYGTGLLSLIKAVQSGHFFFVGYKDHLFELTHVDDLTNLLEAILNNKKAFNQTFIVSEKNPKSFKEVIEVIAQILHVAPPKKHIPKPIFKCGLEVLIIAARLAKFKIPFSAETYKTLILDRAFDASKAEKVLGYKPSVKIETGLKELIGWYKTQGWL